MTARIASPSLPSIRAILLFALFALALTTPLSAQVTNFDANPAWPLCGNYYLTAPSDWDPATTGCPEERWGMPDLINDTYGPRLLDGRYDWHRGLDLHTDDADGRPVFSITCGKVKSVDDVYNGTVVVEHYPGHTCTVGETVNDFPRCHRIDGCYYSRYRHLEDAVVSVGDRVEKGELVGTSGRNIDSTTDPDWANKYPHVHFEIRSYLGGPDYYARRQREAIHPLRVLPYDDNNMTGVNLTIPSATISELPSTDPSEAEVVLTLPNDQEELDLVRVDVVLYADGVEQAWTNDGTGYTTPDNETYAIDPPFFDMELWSRQFNYNDSTKVPYEDFLDATALGTTNDGPWLTPYADPGSTHYQSTFPTSHDDDWHLEAQKSATDNHIGEFNGLEVEPENFNRTYAFYELTLRFEELPTVPADSTVCLKAWATDVAGNTTDPNNATWGDCSGVP